MKNRVVLVIIFVLIILYFSNPSKQKFIESKGIDKDNWVGSIITVAEDALVERTNCLLFSVYQVNLGIKKIRYIGICNQFIKISE